MSILVKIRVAILSLLLLFVILSSVNVHVAEFYSLVIYPAVSFILSFVSSIVPFSLDEWGILLMILVLICFPFIMRLKYHKKWKTIIIGETEIILWIYVWFYIGWGINYYRTSFFTRMETKPARFDEKVFKHFIYQYTDSVNKYYCEIDTLIYEDVHRKIKSVYSCLSPSYGLAVPRSFQNPKKLSFSSLYSSCGVLGFMGPFFSESHINHDVTPLEYPFTYAHELSHLLGISSEAEANFWAYQICISSECSEIKYSGYFGLFSYVLVNARYLLSEDDYKNWIETVRPEVKIQFNEKRKYWSSLYSPLLGNIQSAIYDIYLKSNRVSSGQKNYAEVIGLLLSLSETDKIQFAEN